MGRNRGLYSLNIMHPNIKGNDNKKGFGVMLLKMINHVSALRLLDLLTVNILLSLFLTICIAVGIVPDILTVKAVVSTLFALAFIIINYAQLKVCCKELNNKKAYFASNYIAYFIFAAANLGIYCFGVNGLYTWIFSIARAFEYWNIGISAKVSAFIFHIIMIILIAVIPKILMHQSCGTMVLKDNNHR